MTNEDTMRFQIPSEEQANKLEAEAKVLLTEYASQIPAHSNYLIIGAFGTLTILIAVILGASRLSFWLTLGIDSVTMVVAISLIYVGIRFLIGRLRYYETMIDVLKELLSVYGEPKKIYYRSLYLRSLNDLNDDLSFYVLCETLYRIEYGFLYYHYDTKEGKITQWLCRETNNRKCAKGKTAGFLQNVTKDMRKKETNIFGMQQLGEYHKIQLNTFPPSRMISNADTENA